MRVEVVEPMHNVVMEMTTDQYYHPLSLVKSIMEVDIAWTLSLILAPIIAVSNILML